jgi:hypothetical protein
MLRGASDLGVEFDALVAEVVSAMSARASDLGLAGS